MLGVRPARAAALAVLVALCAGACDGSGDASRLTFSASALGAEADIVRRQIDRFRQIHPDIDVELRVTPDAADQRHQLYVQWLNARAADPDIVQLDVIWTPEFAGAGWLLPVEDGTLDVEDFVPAAIEAARWRGEVFAVPWFIDLGLLYWRTDLMTAPPQSLTDLREIARRLHGSSDARFGFVWQGARYEGLITVFLEHLAAFGGGILDDQGRVIVDRPPAVRALTFMRDALEDGWVPASALTWQEEQTRFAFQNGQAAFMRNWPYAWALLETPADSRVAGRFAVAPLPAAEGGRAASALGGSHLAVNAWTENPAAAWALVRFLTAPEQMLERARVAAQLPARRSLYESGELADALPFPLEQIRALVDAAVARPATPVYSELSELLQVRIHRALSGQQPPAEALRDAAREIEALLARSRLVPEDAPE